MGALRNRLNLVAGYGLWVDWNAPESATAEGPTEVDLTVVLALAISVLAGRTKMSPDSLTRLDGSKLSVTEADSFARRTLLDAHITGTQIALINHGQLVWSAAYGLRHKDPDLPMDSQTTTWAASITKAVFGTYVMHLVEGGEFDLDLPVVRQLSKPLNEFEAYKEKAADIVKDPNWALVTPRMLLSHSSGLKNFASFEPDKKMHLVFKPGTQFRYSGEGINLLQLIVEEKKHKPLDELLQESFFAPLAMTRTGLIYRKEFESNVADRFDASENFHAQTRRFPARGAGSMTSSAGDLAKFVIALMDGKLLKPATQKAMLRPQILLTSLHQIPLGEVEPEGKETVAVGAAYGLGWGVLTRTKFGPAFFKEGHGDGAQTFLICFPQQKAGMIIMSNSDNAEFAFRPLSETILGYTVSPWEWHGYTSSYILESRKPSQ